MFIFHLRNVSRNLKMLPAYRGIVPCRVSVAIDYNSEF
jgi:hypothetical protein